MRRMDGGDWISLAGVAVSAVSAVWAVVWAFKAKRSEAAAGVQAALATQAAVDAAAAAERSAGAAERSASALESQAQLAVEQAEAAEGVPWRLVHSRGDTYELRNTSDQPKFYVKVTGPKIHRRVETERLDGRSALQFMAIPAMGLGDEILVTWHQRSDASDDERTWSGMKPAKPR